MLVFITTIRHPHNSNDFGKVESLFEMSLRSVCSQTDAKFRVIVVTNVKPRIGYDDPRVIYHLVDFPPPSTDRCATTSLFACVRDKGSKLLSGMLLARRFRPDYFAFFDADDLVSRRLAAFVNTTQSAAGWYVDAGYVVNYRSWRVQRKSGLVRYCGTSLIPKAAELLRLADVDAGLSEFSTQTRAAGRRSTLVHRSHHWKPHVHGAVLCRSRTSNASRAIPGGLLDAGHGRESWNNQKHALRCSDHSATMPGVRASELSSFKRARRLP